MGYTVAFDSIPSLLLKITAVYLQNRYIAHLYGCGCCRWCCKDAKLLMMQATVAETPISLWRTATDNCRLTQLANYRASLVRAAWTG